MNDAASVVQHRRGHLKAAAPPSVPCFFNTLIIRYINIFKIKVARYLQDAVLETCPPGAVLRGFRTWCDSKPTHQAHFCGVFVPGATD